MSLGVHHQQEALCRFREQSTATYCLLKVSLLEQINQLCLGRTTFSLSLKEIISFWEKTM